MGVLKRATGKRPGIILSGSQRFWENMKITGKVWRKVQPFHDVAPLSGHENHVIL